MKPAPFCPHCGYDLVRDQPIILNDFSMFGPGSPLHFKGRSIRLSPAERMVCWTLLKASPAPVSLDVLIDRLGSEGDEKCIEVFVCRIRRKLREAGAPNIIETARRHNKRAYVWLLKEGQNAKTMLDHTIVEPVES